MAGKACIECHKQLVSFKELHSPVKEQKCGLCHNIPVAGGLAGFMEAPERLCFKCHTKENFKGTFVHGPFAVGACVTCHDPHGSNTPKLMRVAGRQMCLTCHTDMEARFTNARFQHKPTENGCTDCHSPHASEQRYQLRAAASDLCAGCHKSIFDGQDKAAVKHSPVKDQRACLNCHDPHMAAHERLLLVAGIDICMKCHDRKVKAGKDELADMKKLLAENPEHHGPIQEKDCSGCHRPHGSDHFRLLSEDYPKEFYAPYCESNYELCFRCHESSAVKDERTTTLTDFRDGDRNLHFVHVNKSPKGRTCRSCHETHASALPNHIRAAVPFGTWNLPVGFKKTENGGSCAPGCHAPQKYERRGAQAQR